MVSLILGDKMNTQTQLLTEKDFDKKYSMNKKLKSEHFQDGRFETFGKDLETVLNQCKKNEKTVWTCVDDDEGMAFIAGYHLVNRIYYLITNEPWEDSNEEYIIESYSNSDE